MLLSIDDAFAKLSITMHRNDGGIVDAELIRPRAWPITLPAAPRGAVER